MTEQAITLGKRIGEIRFPICSSCRTHARLDAVALGISLACGLMLPPVVYFALDSPFVKRGLMLLLMLYGVVAIGIGAAVYWLLCKCIAGRTAACADTSWPVERASTTAFNDVLGGKTERTDERMARDFAREAARLSGPDAVALVFRNMAYARMFIADNGGDPAAIHVIENAI